MENEQMVKDVEEQCSRIYEEKCNISTPDEQSKGLLLVKALLANGEAGEKIAEVAEKSVTYSDDPSMKVSVQEKDLYISICLETDASVSLFICSTDNSFIQPVFQNRDYVAGNITIKYTVPRFGIYSIRAIVNGCVYENKIAIN